MDVDEGNKVVETSVGGDGEDIARLLEADFWRAKPASVDALETPALAFPCELDVEILRARAMTARPAAKASTDFAGFAGGIGGGGGKVSSLRAGEVMDAWDKGASKDV